VPAAYCGDEQLPPEIDELVIAIELDERELGAILDDGWFELLDDEETAPSQAPTKVHSCH
jgi:hypothetical protein